MNILHVICSVNPATGGPIEGIKQLRGCLVRSGHHVEIASLDSPDMPYVKDCEIPVYPLGPGTLKYAFAPRLLHWLRENRGRYDAVIVNGIWQFHSFAVWRALRNSDTPYVLFTHGMLDLWSKKRFPLKHVKKWMYWPWAEYRVLRDAQAVLFTCEEERLLARQIFWLYRCNEVVVGYGTATPKGDPQAELNEFFGRYPELRGKRLLLFMGRINPKKGCDMLLEAFAKVMGEHPEWRLVMAGPDQVGWQKELELRAEKLGIGSRVTWTGMIRGAMKWGALRAAEVFVLPSHHENFGIVVAEALAVGAPTLISKEVNIWREIAEDGAGLVAPDTFEGTRSLLQSYLDLPEPRKLAMREAALACFTQRFEITKAADTLQSVLAGVTATAQAPQ
jgi:glycosyltransferase involved in cell wall biosynthesis